MLFRAHVCTPAAQEALRTLLAEVDPGWDVWLVGFCATPAHLDRFGLPTTRCYGPAALSTLPYPAKLADIRWDRTVGDNDLPILAFFHERPHYDRYWFVEYDVRFNGHWGAFFADLRHSPADLLGTTIQTYAEHPQWILWDTLRPPGDLDRTAWVKSFMPVGRASRAAMAAIDAGYRRGWSGHSEATWATMVTAAGLTLEDIGGTGRFVPPARRGRYYWNTPFDPHLRPGSFVFRPTLSHDGNDQAWTGREPDARAWVAAQLLAPDMLVHPVKC